MKKGFELNTEFDSGIWCLAAGLILEKRLVSFGIIFLCFTISLKYHYKND